MFFLFFFFFPFYASAIGFVDGPAPLHCPTKFEDLFNAVQNGANLYNQGQFTDSKQLLSNSITKWANTDPLLGMECSLGMASAYRVLTFNYCANPRTNNRRAYQIGLRILHQAMNWITHVFVKSGHDDNMIDGSQWPITIQQINEELTIVQNVLKQNEIENGHQVHHRIPKNMIPLSFQPLKANPSNSRQTQPATPIAFTKDTITYDPVAETARKHRIGIVSLCAYPDDHVLPGYAISNHQIYAQMHGYNYYVETKRIDPDRPHAWGKIKLLERYLQESDNEWLMWFDCDTYFMNMTVTIESVLYRYAGIPMDEVEQDRVTPYNPVGLKKKKIEMKVGGQFVPQPKVQSLNELILDPEVNMIIAEDNAMLNSGTFFIRKSQWSVDLMRTVYGDAKTSPWVDHPWWENAALTWNFLKDVPHRFVKDDLEAWPALSRGTGADNLSPGGAQNGANQKYFNELPEEEKLYYISKEMENIYTPEVRIAPQHIFNSYHPVTSRFQHDTWEPGKYVLAFNGVLSSTSPTVIRILYGNYYRTACELNGIMEKCIPVLETLPWLQSEESLIKENFKPEDKAYGHAPENKASGRQR